MISLIIRVFPHNADRTANDTLNALRRSGMGIRTDLAVEFSENRSTNPENIKFEKRSSGEIVISDTEIVSEKAAKEVGKPKGKYVMLESANGSDIFEHPDISDVLSDELHRFIGETDGAVLVVGIGNKTVTPDAIGPKTAERVLVTRHLPETLKMALGIKNHREVSVICPGVSGQTGMEALEILEGVVRKTNAESVIIIDALAARDVSRLGTTVQLSNVGIRPGSGIGNSRAELSENTLGVKCTVIGVPTVVDASTLSYSLTGKSISEHEPLIVTPRNIDRFTEKAAYVISSALNKALQPDSVNEIMSRYV